MPEKSFKPKMNATLTKEKAFLEMSSIDGNPFNLQYTLTPYTEKLMSLVQSSVFDVLDEQSQQNIVNIVLGIKRTLLLVQSTIINKAGLVTNTSPNVQDPQVSLDKLDEQLNMLTYKLFYDMGVSYDKIQNLMSSSSSAMDRTNLTEKLSQ